MSHPNYAANALKYPDAIDDMRSAYLNALRFGPHDSAVFELPEPWWTAGHLEQELYRRLVTDAHNKWAPKPQYEAIPGISTGNGAWPSPKQPPTGVWPGNGQAM